jgi:tRNA pseudouridine55 synthase
MNEILVLYKEVGETPLACLERFRAVHPEYKDVPMTYAGRLDPMAEGLLLVLAGSKVYDKDKYLGLSKTYEAEIVFGVSTDTYDILGIPAFSDSHKEISEIEIKHALQKFVGKQMQKYPPYSSKPVDGTPLFALARAGELDGKEIPEHEVEIMNIEMTNMRTIPKEIFLAEVLSKIGKVKGGFRQEEIARAWEEGIAANLRSKFAAVSLTISCSSGTYIRSIAQELGVALSTSATLFSLKRTQLGEFSI